MHIVNFLRHCAALFRLCEGVANHTVSIKHFPLLRFRTGRSGNSFSRRRREKECEQLEAMNRRLGNNLMKAE
jgi:hypothetical protein